MMENIKRLAMQHGTPLLLFCPKTFQNQYRALQTCLPQVKHHYALKALPYDQCIRVIGACDGYLDVASIGEIRLVQDVAPELLSRCIYTHPIKKISDIECAIQAGVTVMVADNPAELEKLLPYAREVKLLLRIAFPNPGARCDLSAKFGATIPEVKSLIARCMAENVRLLGCSFHVGSQMPNPDAHVRAIAATREIYDWCCHRFGVQLPVLNIGGGFPARLNHDIPDLPAFCAPIHSALVTYFPDTEIWSEPGRCLAADCMASVCQVVGKKLKNNRLWYYLDDGVYNTFSGKIYDHADYQHIPVTDHCEVPLRPSVIAGPTCDSIDVLKEDILLPELSIGDLLFTPQVGAYGWASRTQFNMLEPVKIIDTNVEADDIEPSVKRNQTKKFYPENQGFKQENGEYHLTLSHFVRR